MPQLVTSSAKGQRVGLWILNSLAISLAIVLILQPAPSDALKCYSCNSKNDDACMNGDLTQFEKECAATDKGCRKWYFAWDEEGKGDIEERVVRECAESVTKNDCESGYGASGKRFKRTICQCTADNCNKGGPRITVSSSTVLALVVTWALFFGYR